MVLFLLCTVQFMDQHLAMNQLPQETHTGAFSVAGILLGAGEGMENAADSRSDLVPHPDMD